MISSRKNSLIIKYPVENTALFSDTLVIHFQLGNNGDPHIGGVVFELDGEETIIKATSGTATLTNISEGSHILVGTLLNKKFKKIEGTSVVVDFKSYESTLKIDQKLTTIIKSTIPEFVVEDYPNFVQFLEAYYEWMYSSNNPFYAPLISEDYKDIDKTPDFFVKYFKEQFLKDFPENLTKDKESGEKLNEKTLIKNIVDFYSSKGTEKSIKFLMRILYDSYSEIYNPKLDLFRSSDSKWIERKSFKCTYSSKNIHQITKKRIYQEIGNSITAIANVDEIFVFRNHGKNIVEVFFSTVNGEINFNKSLLVDIETEIIELTPIQIVSSLSIVDSGVNYQINDKITVYRSDNTNSIGHAVVSDVNSKGEILKLNMVYFGEAFKTYYIDTNGIRQETPIEYSAVVLDSDTKHGTSAEFVVNLDYIANYSGFWVKKNSHPSSMKKLPDNKRFQELSYVVRVDMVLNRYLSILKKLAHPAGIEALGDILLYEKLEQEVNIGYNFFIIYSPFIGNYCAFRPYTEVNIRDETNDLYPNGFDPESENPDQDGTGDTAHIPGTNRLDEGVSDLTFRFLPEVSDVANFNEYWVVYPHPNTEINTYTNSSSFFDITIEDFVRQEKIVL